MSVKHYQIRIVSLLSILQEPHGQDPIILGVCAAIVRDNPCPKKLTSYTHKTTSGRKVVLLSPFYRWRTEVQNLAHGHTHKLCDRNKARCPGFQSTALTTRQSFLSTLILNRYIWEHKSKEAKNQAPAITVHMKCSILVGLNLKLYVGDISSFCPPPNQGSVTDMWSQDSGLVYMEPPCALQGVNCKLI